MPSIIQRSNINYMSTQTNIIKNKILLLNRIINIRIKTKIIKNNSRIIQTNKLRFYLYLYKLYKLIYRQLPKIRTIFRNRNINSIIIYINYNTHKTYIKFIQN